MDPSLRIDSHSLDLLWIYHDAQLMGFRDSSSKSYRKIMQIISLAELDSLITAVGACVYLLAEASKPAERGEPY